MSHLLLWEKVSIGGLAYNLMRSGTLPLLLREMDAERLAEADLLVSIAPGDRFSAGEAETVARWVETGGKPLVSVGWEESEARGALLEPFGLPVGNVPLGPVKVRRGVESQSPAGPVRFQEAWPVESPRESAQPIKEGYGHPLAVYQPWERAASCSSAIRLFYLVAPLRCRIPTRETRSYDRS